MIEKLSKTYITTTKIMTKSNSLFSRQYQTYELHSEGWELNLPKHLFKRVTPYHNKRNHALNVQLFTSKLSFNLKN